MADPSSRSSDEEKTVHDENERTDMRSVSLVAKEGPLNEHGMVTVSKKLKNPLSGMDKNELLADVEAFAKEKELEDILPLLQRGALVAQNPKNFETVEELTPDEKEWLRMETTNRWKQPKMMFYMTSEFLITCLISPTPANLYLFSLVCWLCYCPGNGSNCCKWFPDILLRKSRFLKRQTYFCRPVSKFDIQSSNIVVLFRH